jgi:hypothetical protein
VGHQLVKEPLYLLGWCSAKLPGWEGLCTGCGNNDIRGLATTHLFDRREEIIKFFKREGFPGIEGEVLVTEMVDSINFVPRTIG